MSDEPQVEGMNGGTVPMWVLIGCYILGWGLGVALIATALLGDVANPALLISAGAYMIFFPAVREGPGATIKRMFN